MNDAELKKTFPFGVMVIRQNPEPFSSTAVVGGGAYESEEETFELWYSPYQSQTVLRTLEAKGDGYETRSEDGTIYFLRPLTKEQEVKF